MVNTTDFIGRLERLLRHYDLSASAFADRIHVQRSSMSHLLSGRNKPSLDFVLKVVKAFPEVNLYWLLNGKGSFPATPKDTLQKTVAPESVPETNSDTTTPTTGKTIDKIIIFYSDGSFKSYHGH